MIENDHRNLGEAQLLGGTNASVPSDDLAGTVDEHRHRPSELDHRSRDLRDLLGPVRLGVLRIGLQPHERPGLDVLRREAQRHAALPSQVDSGFHWTPTGLLTRD